MIRAVEFEVGGVAKRLRYDFNALADIEDKAGMSVNELFAPKNMGFHAFRLILWAGLKWKDRGLTVERAGMIINDMLAEGYSFDDLAELITKAFEQSGLIDAATAEEMEENPTKAASPKKSKSSKK